MTKEVLLSTHHCILRKERNNKHNFQFESEEVGIHYLHVLLIK